MTVQQYCLRWNNHQPNFISVFSSLLSNQSLVDVTLAAEGKHLQAHKVVLSACSSYFQSLFTINPCKHPIVILKDVKFLDLKVMVDFMYHGEVNVSQEQLPCILKTAEMLKIKGLTEIPVDQSAARTSEKCELPPQEENWSFSENVRITSPPSPTGRRKRLKKNVSSTGTESESAPTSSEILLGTVENINVIGTILKSESERYSNPTENTQQQQQHPHLQQNTTPQKCNGLTVPIVQQAGPSHEPEPDLTHHVSLQVTPHDLNTTQTVDCSPIEIPRITTTQQTTPGIQWNILDTSGYTHYPPPATEIPGQYAHNPADALNSSPQNNHLVVNPSQSTSEYANVHNKRKRSINPQGDENFIRALDAVRFGGIGFCKAARMYGVNNRTLWLEYKKRGYPNFRLSIKNRNQAQTQLQSVEMKESDQQEHIGTQSDAHYDGKINNQMSVNNANVYDDKHVNIKNVVMHRKFYERTDQDQQPQTINFQAIQLEHI